MGSSLTQRLQAAPVIPLIQADDPVMGSRTAAALVDGGLTVLEVVLRTEAALASLSQIQREVPEALVGAGTVLSEEQARAARAAGATFIVSPGLDPRVVEFAQGAGLPVFPGVATATELQRAYNLGLRAVKFFPAAQAGGVATLKALGAVFRDVNFMPTGGITPDNLGEYLALSSVLACGGSWLTPAASIAAGDFEVVTRLARGSIEVANGARP